MIDFFKASTYPLINEDVILAVWNKTINWGDALSPLIIEKMSKKKVLYAMNLVNLKGKPVHAAIGSILDAVPFKNLIIWGSGFIRSEGKLAGRPNEIRAVRGPLTRRKFLDNGIECPEVYGDPALIIPQFIKPEIHKKYKLGIVPHYVDKNEPMIKEWSKNSEVRIIDVEGGIKPFIEDICHCKFIVSSSLHGLICSDAYGIPSLWIRFSDRIIGGNFKFQDYFHSVGRDVTEPLLVSDSLSVEDLIDRRESYRIDFNEKELLDSCPFKFGE